MTLRTTRWSPDTCDCIIDQSWDDSLPQDQIVTTLSNIVNKCSFHSILATNTGVWDSVMDENPRKNNTLQHILDNGPNTLYDLQGTSRILKQTVNYNFSWSGTAPNRILTVSFTGVTLTNTQKNSIQTFLNTKFGTNKVIIA